MNRNFKEVELINTLLRSLPQQHQTVKDQMLYERGYLTGLLASLAHNDSYIQSLLIKKVNDLSRNHR